MSERENTIDKLGQLHQTVTVNGRGTRIRMEPIMWEALAEICTRESQQRDSLIDVIDQRRGEAGLAAATRVFVISYFRQASEPAMSAGGFAEGGPSHSRLVQAALDACGPLQD